MERKNDRNAGKQAGKILHHLSGVSDLEQYFMLQESPAIIFITAQALFLWFYRWFHLGLMGVSTVFKDGLKCVLSVVDYCMLAVPEVV
jgi:hypothetical protein